MSDTHGLTLNFPIRKIDEERKEVWGYATKEALDSQGEIVDYEASKSAFAEWTDMISQATGGKSMGNVREMHGQKAVGKLIAWQPNDEEKGIWVGAKLSDSTDGKDAWQKVKEGVLTGFSIGAPSAERVMDLTANGSQTRVVGYKLAELSLVDNPACPGSFFQSVKLAKSAEREGKLMLNMQVLDFAGVGDEPRGVNIEPKISEGNVSTQEGVAKGKKIGPNQRTAADPPGAQTPKLPSLEPMASPPKPAKDAGVTGLDTGKPGGPHETASEMVSVPDGQGKDADANAEGAFPAPADPHAEPDGDEAMHDPHAAPGMVPLPPARKEDEAEGFDPSAPPMKYGFCAMCGSKMADAEAMTPYHKQCEASARMKAASAKLDFAGLSKALDSSSAVLKLYSQSIAAADGKFAAVTNKINTLEKRLKRLEDQPLPGGPMRTELPTGVAPVEKGGAAADPRMSDKVALEKAMSIVADPFVRDRISQQLAKMEIKRTFVGG